MGIAGLEVHKQIDQEECRKYKSSLEKTKTDYHRAQVTDFIDKLSAAKLAKVLPLYESASDLACIFSEFFQEKIQKVKDQLDSLSPFTPVQDEKSMVPQLSEFKRMSHAAVRKIVLDSLSKSCPLDPIPSWLLKRCHNELLPTCRPTVCDIVNHSITSGEVPGIFKEAQLTPLIKKPTLDPESSLLIF